MGWGCKASGRKAKEKARKFGLPCLLLEDGFLRSIERRDPPISLVVDDLGIYYDANNESRLEKLIKQPLSEEQISRAKQIRDAWKSSRVSKYNHARDYNGYMQTPYVLVIDQIYGDASITNGWSSNETFQKMLNTALSENPGHTVFLKSHPDAGLKKKRGYLSPMEGTRNSRVCVSADDYHPASLIENADAVYTVTSQIGFEALIWGKPVRCFGMPFYAGWGLTRDELLPPSRREQASIEQLIYAALVSYPRYVHPETGRRCEPETIIEYIALQRKMRERFPHRIYAVGFSRWKKPIIKNFLAGSEVHFRYKSKNIPQGSTIAVWGSKIPSHLPAETKIIQVEDGFLRSVGLGANFARPISWVQDSRGIYYDPNKPSQLEEILQTTRFDQNLIERAKKLRQIIRKYSISKYNESAHCINRTKPHAPVLLVPGQVECDASIRLGSPKIKTNIDLLRSVRRTNPEAYIIYKPHPDTVHGLRPSGRDEDKAQEYCDEIVTDVAISSVFDVIDEVHTITSLAGFEALLRDIRVVCYGLPFYAGWGLTTDAIPVPRRTRSLTIDELVAGSLILYPAYVSPKTYNFITPEQAVRELVEWKRRTTASSPKWIRAVSNLAKVYLGEWK